jgi:hypothetical protein
MARAVGISVSGSSSVKASGGSSGGREGPKHSSSWTYTQILTSLLGTSVLLISLFNIYQVHRSSDALLQSKADQSVNNVLKDFMEIKPSNPNPLTSDRDEKGTVHQVSVAQYDRMHEADEGEPIERDYSGAEESDRSTLAGLSCADHGGPLDEFAREMVYWQDISSDSQYTSPFRSKSGQPRRYMTFEPDGGGWNNIRMAMETVLGLGIAMGRTVVLPPEQRMYLLAKDRGRQKTDFGFADFFPMHELATENAGLEMITMQEFLQAEAMTGNLRDKHTGQISFPPENRTDWDGQDVKPLKEWLHNVTHTPFWAPEKCMAAFPASGNHKDVEVLKSMLEQIQKEGGPLQEHVLENPTPVDATPIERMRENLARRKELCVYDETMQKEPVVHFMCNHRLRVRMLVHFYAFLFFEDWREDLWMKRFMRDHMRYIDAIQCPAARIVHALREYARQKDPVNNPRGDFDTFHVRRGDFQFKRTRISAEDILSNTRDELTEGAVIYIATDERDKAFFDPLKQFYDVKFMDDFKNELANVNTNYYGMIDQLVASRGQKFFGCWHSTFTGFIARIRGYHSVKDNLAGFEKGTLPTTFYYATLANKYVMHEYAPLHGAFFNREVSTKKAGCLLS